MPFFTEHELRERARQADHDAQGYVFYSAEEEEQKLEEIVGAVMARRANADQLASDTIAIEFTQNYLRGAGVTYSKIVSVNGDLGRLKVVYNIGRPNERFNRQGLVAEIFVKGGKVWVEAEGDLRPVLKSRMRH